MRAEWMILEGATDEVREYVALLQREIDAQRAEVKAQKAQVDWLIATYVADENGEVLI